MSAEIRPLGAYAKVREAGPLVFVAGTSARQADGTIAGTRREGERVVHDVAVQLRACLAAVASNLASVGLALQDCVDITAFLTDMNDFAAFNAAYAEFFGDDAPTRTTVGVASLPHPDMVVEIKAIALRRPAP